MPPELHAISALIFDFDGTLAVPTLDFSLLRQKAESCLAPYAEAAGPAGPAALAASSASAGSADAAGSGDSSETALSGESAGRAKTSGPGKAGAAEAKPLPVMERLEALCAALPPAEAARLRRECLVVVRELEMEAARRSSLFPFARPMLEALRGRGFRTAVVTRNCRDAVLTVFPDLLDYCPVLVTRDDVRRVKPHPEHMLSALTRLGRRGGESLSVGDHPMDIEAGRRVGALTAAVASGESDKETLARHKPDILADNAAEVVRLLNLDF